MSDQAIVLRWSESENTLRSTGEPPGVVILAFPEGHPTLAIDRGWEPRTVPFGTTTADWFEEGISPLAEVADAEVLAEACFGKAELLRLYQLAIQTSHAALPIVFGLQKFDVAREIVDLVEELAAAVNKRLEAWG